jgi:hypothetical protein
MPLAGLEPAIPATKRPQIYALDRAATEIVSQTSHMALNQFGMCLKAILSPYLVRQDIQ